MNKFTRFATKPVRLPLNWAFPRHAINGAKELRFSNTRYPVCPNCSLSRFSLESQTDKNFNAVWSCGSCNFKVATKEPTRDAIQDWCRENAHQVFSNSEYQLDRIREFNEGHEQGFVGINVKRNMIAAYAFLALATVTTFFFFYAAFNTMFFFMLNSLLFTLGILFMGLVFNYRAWLARTNYLYGGNGKDKFHWWLKMHPWFRYPKDIGEPPSFYDGNNMDDDESDKLELEKTKG